MTEPSGPEKGQGSVPEQGESTGSTGETPVEPVDTPAESEPPSLEQQLAERTSDLQRLQAEYVNYKRRVDRDRELVRAQGEAGVLQSLLMVLDDIGRADEHGELEGVRIQATLYFNAKGQLVNFVSDDRYAVSDMQRYRFSTPVADYKNFNGFNVMSFGEAVWHYPDGEFVYGKFELQELVYNVPAL